MVYTLFHPDPTQKLILFQLSLTHTFYLSMPIQQVYKILKQTSIHGSVHTAVSLAHVEEQIEVPTTHIWIIPQRYRQIDILGLAHHAVQSLKHRRVSMPLSSTVMPERD